MREEIIGRGLLIYYGNVKMNIVKLILKPSFLLVMLLSVMVARSQESDSRTSQSTYINNIPCATDDLHDRLIQNDPNYARQYLANEVVIQEHISNCLSNTRSEILTVPVVVHVLHTGEAIGDAVNISDEQIYSAIDALNEDYRKAAGSNGDGNGVDVEIEFCLAVRDPNGNPSSGINRVDASAIPNYASEGISIGNDAGASEVSLKALSNWPNSDYYNIWIVNEIDDNNGGSGIQGFAYYPGASSSVDGAVILFNAFGTLGNLKSYTNMNRTTTHEIGHGLNLIHSFEGGACTETNCVTQGDRVCDTPPTESNTNCNAPACNGAQQVENYMDYTSQTCKNMFTQGQKDRMRAALLGTRSSLLESSACVPVYDNDASVSNVQSPIGYFCTGLFQPKISIKNFGTSDISSLEIIYSVDAEVYTYSYSEIITVNTSVELVLPELSASVGQHIFTVSTSMPNGQIDQFVSNDEISSNFEVISGGETCTVTVKEDVYGSESSWKIKDAQGNTIAQGGPYGNGFANINTHEVCLATGCFDFVMYDSYGDGLLGAAYYKVENSAGDIIVDYDGQEFESQTTNFCIGGSGDLPVVDFSSSVSSACEGDYVNFIDISTAGQISRHWSFEGGSPSTSTEINPTVRFMDQGTHAISLSVSYQSGSYEKVSSMTVDTELVVEYEVQESCQESNTGSVSLVVSGAQVPYSYQWATGEESSGISDVSSGDYSVVVRDANLCSKELTVIVLSESCVGVYELEIEDFLVYPNPSNGDRINISYNGILSDIGLFDVFGRELDFDKEIISDGEYVLYPQTRLVKGMYFLEVYDGNDSVVKKIIVE